MKHIQLYESFEEDYCSKYSKIYKLGLDRPNELKLMNELFLEFSNEIMDLIPDISLKVDVGWKLVHFADEFTLVASVTPKKEILDLDYIKTLITDLNRLYSILSYKYDILTTLNVRNDDDKGIHITDCTFVNNVKRIKISLLDLILNKTTKEHYVYTGKYTLEHISIIFFKKNGYHNKSVMNYINRK